MPDTILPVPSQELRQPARFTSRGEAGMKPARPKSVTYLTWMVLFLAGMNLVRFFEAARQWDFLTQVQAISPAYQVVTGLIWGVLGLVLAFGLWLGRPWAPGLARLAVLAYSAYFLLDRILLAAPLGGYDAWPFALGLSAILSVLVFYILGRARARAFFGS
jgi:hypothetical protein